MKRPPPYKPLASVARSALPGQRDRQPPATLPGDVPEIVERHGGVPVLTITADITIPQNAGFARRLNNLLRQLRTSLEEEAPWLSNIEINVHIPK